MDEQSYNDLYARFMQWEAAGIRLAAKRMFILDDEYYMVEDGDWAVKFIRVKPKYWLRARRKACKYLNLDAQEPPPLKNTRVPRPGENPSFDNFMQAVIGD